MPSAAENLKERYYATGHVNKELIALVPIRATDPVAILIHCNYSCQLVQFVGKNISLRAICLEGSTERSDGNRGRSPRIVVTESMCLEGTTPQDLPQSSIPPHCISVD